MKFGKTYASSNLEAQSTQVSKSEIEFDAYFQEEGKKVHKKTLDVGKEDETLYLNIKVKEGYLRNGVIKIENSNFKVEPLSEELTKVQSISSDENKITLNYINRDEAVELAIKVKPNAGSSFDVKDLIKTASIILEGTYVNNKGKEIEISKTIETETVLDGMGQADVKLEITKYVPFNVNGNKGVILQTSVKSKLADNKLPIKETELEIETPIINGIVPERITLSLKSSSATNGKTSGILEENKDYKIEDGKVIVKLENNKDILAWEKNAEDEVVITYIYGEKGVATEVNAKLNAKTTIAYYGAEVKSATNSVNENANLIAQVGDIVTINGELSESKLFKGYMLAENGKGTSFTNNINVNITAYDLMDKITFIDETSYTDKNGNEFPSSGLYTYTKIDKENLIEILGEDGYINVFGQDGKIITTLNKENTEFKFEGEVSGVIFETSKPVSDGILKLENGREIKAVEYSKAQEELFTGYKVNNVLNIMKNETAIIRGNETKTIELENPTTKAEIEITNNTLSTVNVSEGVDIRATLKTTDPSTALYKNPEVEIVLPKYVTDLDIQNASLVYGKDFKIKDAVKYRNQDGNIAVKVSLTGEQKSYNEDAVTEGATLMMKANVKTNEFAPTSKQKAVLNVTNNATSEIVQDTADLNFVAPAGIATISQVANFEDTGKVATSISGRQEKSEVKVNAPARRATVKLITVNNYQENAENIVILGRTPFAGNKNIVNGEDLKSNFTARMVSGIRADSGIDASQVTVYYSANGDASKDLENKNNGWTTDINTLSEVKSYMIVLNNFTYKTGAVLGFSYEVEIPENLGANQNTHGAYVVYYERQAGSEDGIATIANPVTEYSEGPIFDIGTAREPNLSIRLEANVQDKSEIAEHSIIEYTAYVTNNSDYPVENVVVRMVNLNEISPLIRPDGETSDIIGHGTIEPKATVENKFYIKAGSYVEVEEGLDLEGIHIYDEDGRELTEEEVKELLNKEYTRDDFESEEEWLKYQEEKNKYSTDNYNKVKIQVTAEVSGFENKFISNERENTVTKAVDSSKIEMKLTTPSKTEIYGKGNTIEFYLNTLTDSDLQNAVITCKLPKGITYVEATKGGTYNEDTKIVTWNFDKLDRSDTIVLKGKVDGEANEMAVKFEMTASTLSKPCTSNEYIAYLQTEGFEVSQTSNVSKPSINAGETIRYDITVKNLSNIAKSVQIKDELPKELTFEKVEYIKDGANYSRTENAGNYVFEYPNLEPEETVVVHIVAKAQDVKNTVKITNKVTINGNIEANEVSHVLIGRNGEPEPEEPNKPESKYSISGTAWLDANKDGKRDDKEELLSNINVYLLNSSNNKVISKTTTNKNGVYNFADLKKGRYIVAFEYDNKKYEVTEYRVNGVEDSNNCDVFSKELELDGKKAKFAVTDGIDLNENKVNIDLGLIDSPVFDLELTKGIDLVQVSNSKGVKTYNFKNTDLAKIEIPEKEMKGSVVAITYKMTVKNEGAVAGHVNKIVDYKAKDLSFNSAMNPEWYQDADGNLYNTSLSGKVINPGETVEVSLILTKTMTNENVGISNNTAEIAESSNDQGMPDADSTPGNKNQDEDDFGKADIIIAIKTGGIIFYTFIVIAVLGVFALGAYEINKRVLRKIQ